MKENGHIISLLNGHAHNGNHALGSNASHVLTDDEKIRLIESHFTSIMHVLGLNLEDDSLRDSPGRVARMYVNEMFSGLNPANEPMISEFENSYGYSDMLVEKNISVYSCCEHHFVPITGKAHVAYFPGDKVIGLSKINRLAQYYCKRPQVQERLTEDIAHALKKVLNTEDVAVVIDAVHLCVTSRGINDVNSSTLTSHFSGKFKSENIRRQFIKMTR